ncbi:hypothetical protein LCGC14_1308490 [marine sediment metagenome]|uniref:Uncharacterized protein n=1 Tax=marine sediment metagenome TaxID=412755 RepID=A0A0F9KN34_9ZZZZ
MNKLIKGIIAFLGGVDLMFSIFIPIAIALLLINTGNLNNFNAGLVLLLGLLSSSYRTINFWIFK